MNSFATSQASATGTSLKAEPYLQNITKEADFNDLLMFAPEDELLSLKEKLQKAVGAMSTDVRTALSDLARQRLSQLEAYIG